MNEESPEAGGGHALGMPVTPDNRDPNITYSSAPSPTSPQTMLVAPRTKRRSEVFASHESPYFYPAQQHFNILSMDQSAQFTIKIAAKIDRGFFLAANDWTCYRRNYFQLSASFSILGLDTSIHPETPCLLERNGELVQVQKFLICIGAQIQNGEKTIELVQHTPKRDKGPQITPSPTPVRAGGDLSLNASAGSNPHVITFERVQFKTATANNGKRRAAQQYYQVRVDLFAETEMGELVMVATSFSAPLVVRGRSPGHYADNEEAGSSAQPMDSRYAYRNDSISSNGGGPMGSPVGEYPYYPNYSYGASYQYQSLGSASHIAAQPQEGGYYERHNSESYPTSPLTPAGQHPGQMETSQANHSHAYMTPQAQHGFSTASVSPDMYSPPGFVPSGADSPTSSLNRLPQLQGHAQGGHYPYGSPAYSQYPQQQQQDQYDQDHEAQMASLRIHSPVNPSSPVLASSAVPRRQSFSSSLSAKAKGDRPSIGPTRKSRSISMSGITKRAPSKTRTSRTIPATPTKELGMGLGITNDRIPEEEQQA
ncbi:hypothetical protein BGX28_009477 [Mortierella sp. GBA30]|nr:hypothetical protein BGX28_009477 [Mortierella sp. GBA30]